jgi:hypothetical protein
MLKKASRPSTRAIRWCLQMASAKNGRLKSRKPYTKEGKIEDKIDPIVQRGKCGPQAHLNERKGHDEEKNPLTRAELMLTSRANCQACHTRRSIPYPLSFIIRNELAREDL